MLKMFQTSVVSIQYSYTSPSKCKCSSLSRNLMSSSPLTSSFYSLNCFSCGYVIYGIAKVCLTAYTTINIIITIVSTTNGSILPLIIFYTLKSILSYSVFIIEPKAPPSSTLFFLLRTLIGKSMTTFFLFFSVIWDGFCGLSF